MTANVAIRTAIPAEAQPDRVPASGHAKHDDRAAPREVSPPIPRHARSRRSEYRVRQDRASCRRNRRRVPTSHPGNRPQEQERTQQNTASESPGPVLLRSAPTIHRELPEDCPGLCTLPSATGLVRALRAQAPGGSPVEARRADRVILARFQQGCTPQQHEFPEPISLRHDTVSEIPRRAPAYRWSDARQGCGAATPVWRTGPMNHRVSWFRA